jgi:hypothetical protein
MKKLPIIAMMVVPSLLSLSLEAATSNYSNSAVASDAISKHKANPKASTDPFVKSIQQYRDEQASTSAEVSSVDLTNEVNNYIYVAERNISERKVSAKELQEAYKGSFESAIESGDRETIQNVYEDYNASLAQGSVSFFVERRDMRIDLLSEVVPILYENSTVPMGEYKASITNFIETYRDDIKEKRNKFTDNEHKSRINRLNGRKNTVGTTLATARQFNGGCKVSCAIPTVYTETKTVGEAKTEPRSIPYERNPKFRCTVSRSGLYSDFCEMMKYKGLYYE